MEEIKEAWPARFKWLVQFLIISATLNAGLIATLCYFALRDKKTFMAYDLAPIEQNLPKASLTQTNEEFLATLMLSSFEDLIRLLGDNTLLEEGYTKRDLSLTTLVAFHHFDLQRALPHLDIPTKCALFTNEQGDEITLQFFCDLKDQHFNAIRNFTRSEKYPVTTQGIFERLVVAPKSKDLQKALKRTFEYQSMQALFTRAGDPLSDDDLLTFLLAHDWSAIASSAALIKQNPHITLETKRAVLLNLIDQNSAPAAHLLATQDFDYVIKRLSNTRLKSLLSLLGKTHPHHQAIISATKETLRTDSAIPSIDEPIVITPPEPTMRTHIVREGDTLWDISRLYRVPLQALQEANDTESHRLMPGQELIIP